MPKAIAADLIDCKYNMRQGLSITFFVAGGHLAKKGIGVSWRLVHRARSPCPLLQRVHPGTDCFHVAVMLA